MSRVPRVLIISGYFDWVSGYQEVGLARALKRHAEVHVLASDRVSPIFSDSHLERLGVGRRYQVGVRREEGILVKRVSTFEWRSMVWSTAARRAVDDGRFDHVIQVMPGQLLPLAATLAHTRARRTALYGDNAAMYATLPEMQARVKFKVFSLTKGQLYRIVNRHADEVFAYTPHTVQRLKKFAGPKGIRLLPLAFDETEFYPSSQLRRAVREEQGWEHNEFVIVAPGKVQVQKRFGTLVGSINRLAQDGKKVRLLLVGLDDGDASMALRKQISTEQLDGMITAIPFANHARLNALFNAADLGTWPAMPAITIQQAMGTGLRVLIPDNDFVQHLVRDANTGRLFNPDMELGEQLVSLLGREYDDRLAHAGDRRRMARASGNEWLSTANLARRLTASDGVGT